MQRRSPRPADAELTLLELCVCPLHNELFFMVPQYRVNGFHESPFRTEKELNRCIDDQPFA
jgi:hypothetical protein